MKYYKSLLSIDIRHEITIAKIKCAECVAHVAALMSKHHVISTHTAFKIMVSMMNYANRAVRRYYGIYP